jgi:flagellar basal-body rod modification protein FlgD
MQQLAGNFDTFLTLLTTQLKNQDPTSPMDSNQFTQQLVEYSQVEQQINSNDNLKTLIAQGQSAASANAVGFLGKTVTLTNGNAALTNGSANWTYTLGTDAAAATLNVTDANGRTVFSTQGDPSAGAHAFSWNGQGANGNQLPDGTYTLSVQAVGADGSPLSSSVTSKGAVTEVDMSGSTPQLMIGPMALPLSSATLVGTN